MKTWNYKIQHGGVIDYTQTLREAAELAGVDGLIESNVRLDTRLSPDWHTVNAAGIVVSTGKFEGEQEYVPYFYGVGLHRFAVYDRNNVWKFNVTAEDRVRFSQLRQRKIVTLRESSDGHIYEIKEGDEMTTVRMYVEGDNRGTTWDPRGLNSCGWTEGAPPQPGEVVVGETWNTNNRVLYIAPVGSVSDAWLDFYHLLRSTRRWQNLAYCHVEQEWQRRAYCGDFGPDVRDALRSYGREFGGIFARRVWTYEPDWRVWRTAVFRQQVFDQYIASRPNTPLSVILHAVETVEGDDFMTISNAVYAALHVYAEEGETQ